MPRPKKVNVPKIIKSRDRDLFPWNTFLYRLENLDEKRTCWFSCEDHLMKYYNRHTPKCKVYQFTGKITHD